MGIPIEVNFEVIDLVKGIPTYQTLVDRPQRRKIKAIISIERDTIKLEGKGQNIVISFDPKDDKTWV